MRRAEPRSLTQRLKACTATTWSASAGAQEHSRLHRRAVGNGRDDSRAAQEASVAPRNGDGRREVVRRPHGQLVDAYMKHDDAAFMSRPLPRPEEFERTRPFLT